MPQMSDTIFSLRNLAKVFAYSFFVIFLLCLGYIIDLPYVKFIPSTALILFVTFAFYKKNWLNLLGLRGGIRQLIQALIFLFLISIFSFFVISRILSTKGYYLIFVDIFGYLIVPFQTLNEELIFRSLLLGLILKLGLSKNKTIIFPAFIFSGIHWVFYSYNILPENRGTLNIEALVTLFMFGVAANALFLKYQNIYFPWALHCGWNIHRFGSRITQSGNSDPNIRVPEYMTFNLLEGSQTIMILSIFLAAICFGIYAKNADRYRRTPI